MIERFYFTNSQQPLRFKPVLDGTAYEAGVNFRAGRWYLDLINQNSQCFCSVPVVASPDNYDVQLIKRFKTKFVFRASSSAFEVENNDINNIPDFVNNNITPVSKENLTTRFDFNYDKSKIFRFEPVLDGVLYFCAVKWCAGRWYLETRTHLNQILSFFPIIASPNDGSINLLRQFKSALIFRSSGGVFEIKT